MEEKLKFKNIHIVLFFTNIIEYNSLKFANDVLEKIPQLGQPNIFNLPNDIPNEIRMQSPKVIFSNNKDLNLNATITNIELNISVAENIDDLKNVIGLLYDVLQEQGIKIQAIGIVRDYMSSNFDFDRVKETFYKDELLESDLVNSSWYKKEDVLNIWKVINIEEVNGKKILNVRIDINNKGNKENMTKENLEVILQLSYEKSIEFKNELLNKIGE